MPVKQKPNLSSPLKESSKDLPLVNQVDVLDDVTATLLEDGMMEDQMVAHTILTYDGLLRGPADFVAGNPEEWGVALP